MAVIRPQSVDDMIDIIYTQQDTLCFGSLDEAKAMLSKINFTSKDWGNAYVFSGMIEGEHIELSVTDDKGHSYQFYAYSKSFGYLKGLNHIRHREGTPSLFEYSSEGQLRLCLFHLNNNNISEPNKPICIAFNFSSNSYKFKSKESRIYIKQHIVQHNKIVGSKKQDIFEFKLDEKYIDLKGISTVIPTVNTFTLEQLYTIELYLSDSELDLINIYTF